MTLVEWKIVKIVKISPNHSVNGENHENCRKKLFFSTMHVVLKISRKLSEIRYLTSDRKNMGSREISNFGRNFCHFRFRRSIFPKNLGKFRKILKNRFFQKCVKFIFRPLFSRKISKTFEKSWKIHFFKNVLNSFFDHFFTENVFQKVSFAQKLRFQQKKVG